jgi:hypothetical protein
MSKTPLVVLDENSKIHLVDPDVIKWGSGRNPYSVYGYYDPSHGKIVINSENWCLHTILHETLHSVSNFSRIYSSLPNEEFPCEGINELLTGYFLCNLSDLTKTCCQMWTNPDYCFIKRSKTDVMMFYFLSTKIQIENIVRIYLDPEVIDPLVELTRLIKDSGFDFQNIFNTDWKISWVGQRKLKDELTACYGEEFTLFMEQDTPNFVFPPKI